MPASSSIAFPAPGTFSSSHKLLQILWKPLRTPARRWSTGSYYFHMDSLPVWNQEYWTSLSLTMHVPFRLNTQDSNRSAPPSKTAGRLSSLRDDWLYAVPISPGGLRLNNEALKVADSLRLDVVLCRPYQCICGASLNARDTSLSVQSIAAPYSSEMTWAGVHCWRPRIPFHGRITRPPPGEICKGANRVISHPIPSLFPPAPLSSFSFSLPRPFNRGSGMLIVMMMCSGMLPRKTVVSSLMSSEF